MAATVCSIPLFFLFPLLQWCLEHDFPTCFKFGRSLAGTGVYQKDLRVLGAKVGCRDASLYNA